MKKILFLAIYLLSFAALKAQTYTSGHINVVVTDTMYYDSTFCGTHHTVNYHVTIDSSYVGDTVNIVDTLFGALLGGSPYVNTSGISPFTFSAIAYSNTWGGFPSSPGMTYYTSDATKITSGTDTLRYIVTEDSLMVPNPCLYGSVFGKVYIDNNNNCIYDSGDGMLNFFWINTVENLTSGSYGPFPDGTGGSYSWGFYALQKSWMISYVFSLPPYYAFIFPYSSCFSGLPYTVTSLPDTESLDFPIQCSSLCDLQCNALAPGSIRFGRSFYIDPFVNNTGCDTQSGVFTFILDSRVIYDSALSVYPPDTVHGDTLIWNYSGLTNLGAAGTGYWNDFLSSIYLSLNSTVVVGDTLCFSGYTGVPAADVNPLNNTFSFCIPVVYSYDPNSKSVSPQGSGPQGYIPGGHDTLTYTLHFQNTGSAEAININVIDTLDSHIDASSLKILGTSAAMTPQWLASNVVEFTFSNINLPDSGTNFAASQGAVQFKVALNTGLTPGTQIKNTGYIYFDANPAVVTNTTLNTIDSIMLQTPIVPVAKNKITIYPNPAITELTIESTKQPITQITITNLLGQPIYQQSANSLLARVDVSALTPGVYFIKVNGTDVRKFVKE